MEQQDRSLSTNDVVGIVAAFKFYVLPVRISCFCCRAALVGAHTDQRVLTTLLRKHVPEVVTVFEEMEVGRLALAP